MTEPEAPPRVEPDDGALAPSSRSVLLARVVGLLALAWIASLVWRRGYVNREQLTERPGDTLFFFIHLVHLVFHEAGHVIFGFLGEFMGVFGGSLNQVLIPAICAAAFYRTRQYGSGAFTIFWVGQSIADVAIYAADGRDRVLPLLGDDPASHDWGRLLAWWGLVERAESVGRLIFGLGMLVMLASMLLMALEILRAWQSGAPGRPSVSLPSTRS